MMVFPAFHITYANESKTTHFKPEKSSATNSIATANDIECYQMATTKEQKNLPDESWAVNASDSERSLYTVYINRINTVVVILIHKS